MDIKPLNFQTIFHGTLVCFIVSAADQKTNTIFVLKREEARISLLFQIATTTKIKTMKFGTVVPRSYATPNYTIFTATLF